MTIEKAIQEWEKSVVELLTKYNVRDVSKIPNMHEGAVATTLSGVITVLKSIIEISNEPEEVNKKDLKDVLIIVENDKSEFEAALNKHKKEGYAIHSSNMQTDVHSTPTHVYFQATLILA